MSKTTRPGYNVMIEAEGGFMYLTGEENGNPGKVGVAVTDLTTGLYAYGAIMAAIIARGRTGRGQHSSEQEAKRWGTSHTSIAPHQIPSKDSYIMIGASDLEQRTMKNGSRPLRGEESLLHRSTNIEQTFAHPEVVARDMIQEIEHPKAGKIKMAGPVVKYSETKP
ncbi:hypothetical protein BGZ65_008192, partial [Modicella reniformis]